VIVHLQADGRFLVAVFAASPESFRHWLQVSIAAMQADGRWSDAIITGWTAGANLLRR
jgi:hypothetical protein